MAWEAGAAGKEALARLVSFLHRLPTTLRDFSKLPFHYCRLVGLIGTVTTNVTIPIGSSQLFDIPPQIRDLIDDTACSFADIVL